MKYKIFCPSYKRAEIIRTHKYLPQVVYVVSKSEAAKYKKTGVNVWSVPNSVQGNICRVRNYILDNEKCKAIVLLDDDLKMIARWEKQKMKKLDAGEVDEFIEHGFCMAEQLGVKYWGINLLPDKGAYRENTPFRLTSFIGGPFQGHLANPCRYDERLPLKEDYDMSLQAVNRFRRTLRFNAYFYVVDQHGLPGGCAAYRTIQREKEQFILLQKKWGSKIVRKDEGSSRVTRKKQIGYDINPVIQFPIPGV